METYKDPTIIDKIFSNKNLLLFNQNIISLTEFFKDNSLRYEILCSLISSDVLVDENSCKRSIELSNFILNHLDLFDCDADIISEVKQYVENALSIAKRDLEQFQLNNNENNIKT